jgi:hypothetical protein
MEQGIAAGQRFPMERQVQFSPSAQSLPCGSGTTVNMSRRGVLFTTDQSLPEGEPVTLEIVWPVLLDAAVPLKLVTRGRVVWCENSHTAVRFDKWEFRTRGLPVDPRSAPPGAYGKSPQDAQAYASDQRHP